MRKGVLTEIEKLMGEDERVVFVGSDLGAGTMSRAKLEYPDRFFMEGIAEQHIVGFAAGLALEGFVPFVHTISTFLTRRALEQIIVDVALHSLPVKLIGAGGGLVYAPLGPTHQAIDDFALMRAIPGMAVTAPSDAAEATDVVRASMALKGPLYLRLGKGGEPPISAEWSGFEFGRPRYVLNGDGPVILTTGVMVHECLLAARVLSKSGIHPTVVHLPTLAPVDAAEIATLTASGQKVFVVEEHIPTGGLTTLVAEAVARSGSGATLTSISLPMAFAVNYGSQRDHWRLHRLDHIGIAERITSEWGLPGG